MRWRKISDAVVRRLPIYLRVLDEIAQNDESALISSQELGNKAGVGPALVRKDLAWFGEFGKQGVGYEVEYLRSELRKILNLESEIKVALVGVGSLGLALTRYNVKRYSEDDSFNLHIVALFDDDPNKIGNTVEGIEIHPFSKVEEIIPQEGIQMAILTVPGSEAQRVADTLVKYGVKAFLNFAPTKLNVPPHVHVASSDLSLELQRLAYYLQD
ncbi:MAG: redox-sensing transcriptional repressor Rex [Firmicutes bacterium]|nr:redox-sensing transcriptional repressor Rex [Bacillota bacterium]